MISIASPCVSFTAMDSPTLSRHSHDAHPSPPPTPRSGQGDFEALLGDRQILFGDAITIRADRKSCGLRAALCHRFRIRLTMLGPTRDRSLAAFALPVACAATFSLARSLVYAFV